MHEILVETTRGGLPGQGEHVENRHAGSVAVVDASGRLVASAGDPDFVSFTRSTIKPFQALPFVLAGGPKRLGFGPRELALMCASHSAEPMHLAVVAGMLERAGASPARLQCGCHVPLRFAATGASPPPDERFTEVENNCSGKHAGFLAWCALHGAPMDGYLGFDHPLQRAIRERLSQACEVPDGAMRSGIDGCSAPNHAIPLRSLALGYARLGRGADGDGALAPALGELSAAMFAHPELVSGTGRQDLAIMRAAPGEWIAKAGADGVQAIAVRSAGLGIAVKITDGNARAAVTAAIAVLDALGLTSAVQREALAPLARPEIRNARGLRVGEARSVAVLNAPRSSP
ncbi:asparaginase [Zeimonas arvi]|uniref:Asparaginase n=2 Tax=Zeimonas arvi TaxID=2498847 RepID=A0A5C8NUV8_9BURK|nr:asparaginase [Zeimonas arvi]